MGFAEQSNSQLKSNRALDDRRHRRIDRVLETYRNISKTTTPDQSSQKTISERDLADFRNEMKDERTRNNWLRLLALIISIGVLTGLIWLIFNLMSS